MKQLTYTRRFEKLVHKLPTSVKTKLKRQLLLLASSPSHPSLGVRKMVGKAEIWEARVDLQYRLIFKQVGDQLLLMAVGTHEIYRS